MNRRFKSRNRWWTRERCLDAGARFYIARGVAPTNDNWWHNETRFTAQTPDGRGVGSKRPYPSYGALSNYWKGMRPFWMDVAASHPDLNIELDRGDAPWSALEEWWVTESVGLIGRAEVSRLMHESGVGRTEPAIKRRLYELGVNSHNRWGWAINHAERVLNVSAAIITKYVDHGKLPFFQGHKCIYIDPADLFVVQEYNWAKKRHPRELEDAVRKSLMQRACYIILGFDWRAYSYHKIQPKLDLFTGRIKQPRTISPPATPKPAHIKVGDWARITGPWSYKQPGAKGRIGQVKSLVWSPQAQRRTQKRPARPACWVVTIEFRKLKAHGRPEYPRIRYNVPVEFIEKCRKPYEQKKNLVPVPPRIKRKARMKIVGTEVLNNRLNLPSQPARAAA